MRTPFTMDSAGFLALLDALERRFNEAAAAASLSFAGIDGELHPVVQPARTGEGDCADRTDSAASAEMLMRQLCLTFRRIGYARVHGGIIQSGCVLIRYDDGPRLVLPCAWYLSRFETIPCGTVLDAMFGRILGQLHNSYYVTEY